MKITDQTLLLFQKHIWEFYQQQGRTFAWRNVDDPYRVVVSEIMLQQTQTYRVEPKYEQFLVEFPTFQILAQATLRDVLTLWQGLGYNRRGKALHALAQKVVQEHHGNLPNDPAILETFPGIGPATAGSICAFAFNKPTVFIETNIRAVYLHHFFAGKTQVHDKELMPLVASTVDQTNPREWYYALMDYGVYLKKSSINPSRRSKHHTQQSTFEGSDRQIRGLIIKALTEYSQLGQDQLIEAVNKDAARVHEQLAKLCAEKMVVMQDGYFYIG